VTEDGWAGDLVEESPPDGLSFGVDFKHLLYPTVRRVAKTRMERLAPTDNGDRKRGT
jgi:hypothetical protein